MKAKGTDVMASTRKSGEKPESKYASKNAAGGTIVTPASASQGAVFQSCANFLSRAVSLPGRALITSVEISSFTDAVVLDDTFGG